MMVIFWLITPLQGAIFSTQPIKVFKPSSNSTQATLLPMREQSATMDVSMLSRAYSTSWLNQSLPAFTTSTYALLPFHLEEKSSVLRENEIWTSRTTMFTTDMTCWPAVSTAGFKYDNGKGCIADVQFSTVIDQTKEDLFVLLFVGYWDDPRIDWWIGGEHCDRKAAHQFLALAAHLDKSHGIEAQTAIFCEPSYHKQDVIVGVEADTLRPLDGSITAVGERTILDDEVFNRTAFEYLLGTGFPPIEQPRDYGGIVRLEQYATTLEKNLMWPSTNMVGFTAAHYNGSTSQLLDAKILQNTFTAAHKLLFSVVMSDLTAPDTIQSTAPSTLQYTMYGVVLNRVFSLVVEGLLILVAVLAVTLAVICNRAMSNLKEDPSSLAAIFKILRKSPPLLSDFASADCYEERHLLEKYGQHRCKLEGKSCMEPELSFGSDASEEIVLKTKSETNTSFHSSTVIYKPVKPLAMRPWVGALFLAVLTAAMALLVYFKIQETALGGKNLDAAMTYRLLTCSFRLATSNRQRRAPPTHRKLCTIGICHASRTFFDAHKPIPLHSATVSRPPARPCTSEDNNRDEVHVSAPAT
jgi:hypothetical protein